MGYITTNMFTSLTETFLTPASSKHAVAAGKRPNSQTLTHSAPRTERNSTSPTFVQGRSASLPRDDATPTKASSTHDASQISKQSRMAPEKDKPDTFENADADDPPAPPRASIDLDELPIELIGLTDSFIESLQAKVHPTPPNIDFLSSKFQDFYATASSHIATHLAALATRQSREQSAPPARASAASILRAKAASISGRDKSKTPPPAPPKTEVEQQMLTTDELAERKRQRRATELKRSLMEEAVERRLCEGIYDRIYRHRSTQDEAQDDKLRSKTAALDVVGIGPADLGVDLGEQPTSLEAYAAREKEVRDWLEPARKEVVRMYQTHYPLGKLNRLKAAHKSIVDTLSHFHPSSSADEIMPMLIYTLITLPPEKLHVVSDLNFIQRFRWEAKIEGEAAYCLTNLEASISFLETVDLSTLRADEAPSGPVKTPGLETPKTETFPPAYMSSPEAGLTVTAATPSDPELSPKQAQAQVPTAAAAAATTAAAAAAAVATASAASDKTATLASSGLRAAVQLRNRRLSDLVNTPAQALSTASDAVLNTFNAADQSFKTIGNSLEGSYRLFFGKLQNQQGATGTSASGGGGGKDGGGTTGLSVPGEVLVPKTLDEARKLISTPPPAGSEDEASVNGEEPQAAPNALQRSQTTPPVVAATQPRQSMRRSMTGREDKLLSIVGGRKASSASRDHSADSTASSARKVLFAEDETASTTSSGAASLANPVIDSVRNLSNSFNPMSRLSGISGFRGFGRTAFTPAAPTAVDGGDLATTLPDLAAALPAKIQVAPPVKRFMEVHNATDLRISEVGVLLRDYQRLANALRELGGFKE